VSLRAADGATTAADADPARLLLDAAGTVQGRLRCVADLPPGPLIEHGGATAERHQSPSGKAVALIITAMAGVPMARDPQDGH